MTEQILQAKKLFKTSVKVGKSPKRGQQQRDGYMDEGGQVFLPPPNGKGLETWKKTLEDKGYRFAGADGQFGS